MTDEPFESASVNVPLVKAGYGERVVSVFKYLAENATQHKHVASTNGCIVAEQ